MKRLLAALLGVVPVTAEAHLGLAVNDLYAGMLHPLLHLASLLPMLALALWLSCCDAGLMRRLVALYLLAGIVGVLAAWLRPGLFEAEPVLIALAALFGIAVAVYRQLPAVLALPLVAALGFVVGFDNVAKVHAELTNAMMFGVGLVLVMGLVLLHVTALFYQRRQLWVRTSARVAGSWITAVAVMMIALQFAGVGAIPAS